MKTRSLCRAWVTAIVLMLFGSAMLMGQSDPNLFVNITSKQDKAADSKFGKDYHEHLRDMLENRMFNGIKSAYPCIHYLDQSALETMIGVERMAELLGSGSESRLKRLAEAAGARHVGSVNITIIGGTVMVGGSVMDMTAARTVGRAQVTVPAGNDNAIEAAMTQFVTKLVASTGTDGPKCGGWQGEISAKASQHDKGKNPSGDPFTIDTDLSITCQIRGNGGEPPCQVSYSYKMDGKDSSISTSAAGNSRCNASASIYKGLAKIRVGPCQIQGSTDIAVAGTSASDKKDLSLGGWEIEFPVASNARQLSGSKQPDKNTTINYSLNYK